MDKGKLEILRLNVFKVRQAEHCFSKDVVCSRNDGNSVKGKC